MTTMMIMPHRLAFKPEPSRHCSRLYHSPSLPYCMSKWASVYDKIVCLVEQRSAFFFAPVGPLFTQGFYLIPRLHDEAGSTSWLYERTTSARRAISSSQLHECLQYQTYLILQAFMQLAVRAHDVRSQSWLMSWLSGHLNGVILQTFTKLLYERTTSARRASS